MSHIHEIIHETQHGVVFFAAGSPLDLALTAAIVAIVTFFGKVVKA